MNREVHVRFCEGLGVKFPRATRLRYIELSYLLQIADRSYADAVGEWLWKIEQSFAPSTFSR